MHITYYKTVMQCFDLLILLWFLDLTFVFQANANNLLHAVYNFSLCGIEKSKITRKIHNFGAK